MIRFYLRISLYQYLQVLGSDLFTKGYVQESGVKYIVFNIKGQYKALNENTAQEFENLQDA